MKSTISSSLSLAALVALSLSACSSNQQAPQGGSSLHDLGEFNPDSFNAGNTFEFAVNPAFTTNGEQGSEVVDASARAWLDTLDSLAASREDGNFLTHQQSKTPAEIDAHNADLIAKFKRESTVESGYSFDEAKQLYKLLVSQEQVFNHGKFDPQYSIGFCFGRAMIVHAFAKNAFVRVGDEVISKKDIPVRKIWVTGNMSPWKHHVATMVMAKEANAGFWVIDNYVGRVTSATEWMEYIKNDFPNANVLFNMSRANRFSEANQLRYYQVLLDDPFFNGFFREFLKTNVPKINDQGGIDITAPAPMPVDTLESPLPEAGGIVPEVIAAGVAP